MFFSSRSANASLSGVIVSVSTSGIFGDWV